MVFGRESAGLRSEFQGRPMLVLAWAAAPISTSI